MCKTLNRYIDQDICMYSQNKEGKIFKLFDKIRSKEKFKTISYSSLAKN